MGKLILCRHKESKKPYIVREMGVRLHSLEELCYLIYNNIYVINNDFFSEELLEFIGEEIGEKELQERLEELKKNRAPLAELVVTVLKYVDYYGMDEIVALQEILDTLDTQNVYERLKARGDNLLKSKRYHSAIRNYLRIVDGTPDFSLSGLFYAKVYHNIGVAYAQLMFYQEAAEYFAQSYKIGQHEESKRCQLAAERLAQGDHIIEREDAPEIEYQVKGMMETLTDNARYSDEYRRLNDLEKEREEGFESDYQDAATQILDDWKREYMVYQS